MSDIQRSSGERYEIIQRDDSLKRHHRQIQISEKLNLIKQLEVRLEHIQQVEVEQVKLQMAIHKKEAESLAEELADSEKIIDVEPIGGN
jgi:hypothetical protein